MKSYRLLLALAFSFHAEMLPAKGPAREPSGALVLTHDVDRLSFADASELQGRRCLSS
jgi:hypothetical protein